MCISSAFLVQWFWPSYGPLMILIHSFYTINAISIKFYSMINTNSSCAYHRHILVQWFCQSYGSLFIFIFKIYPDYNYCSFTTIAISVQLYRINRYFKFLHGFSTWMIFWRSYSSWLKNAFCTVDDCVSCYTVAATCNLLSWGITIYQSHIAPVVKATSPLDN
jgi:hypothetical protein